MIGRAPKQRNKDETDNGFGEFTNPAERTAQTYFSFFVIYILVNCKKRHIYVKFMNKCEILILNWNFNRIVISPYKFVLDVC